MSIVSSEKFILIQLLIGSCTCKCNCTVQCTYQILLHHSRTLLLCTSFAKFPSSTIINPNYRSWSDNTHKKIKVQKIQSFQLYKDKSQVLMKYIFISHFNPIFTYMNFYRANASQCSTFPYVSQPVLKFAISKEKNYILIFEEN